MEDKARVVKIKKNFIVLELQKSAKCNSCKACCFNKNKTLNVKAYKDREYSIGEEVTITPPQKEINSASFIMYIIPLLFVFVGIFIANKLSLSDGIQILVGAGFFAVSLLVVFLIDKLFTKQKYMCKIIVKEQGEKND